MSIISSADTGGEADLPEIANSIRLNGSNNYLTRTFGTPTNASIWTISAWVKRSKLAAYQAIFTTAGGPASGIWFDSSDFLMLQQGGVGNTSSTAVFRDPSAHLHVVVSYNGTTATGYVNNVSVVSRSSSMGSTNGSGTAHAIGRNNYTSAEYIDGYLSNVCFIDGQALAPSAFAYTDPNGQWRSLSRAALVTLASGAGNNNFFLPFDNGSSTTTLGNDVSSKNNDWTLTNMVRDGSVNDCWSYDTPTNNFATLNPLAKATNDSASNGALLFTGGTSGTVGFCPSSIAMSSGKWYWEVVLGSAVGNSFVGVVDVSVPNSGNLAAGAFSGGYDYKASSGNKCNNSSLGVAYGASYTSGDVIGVAFDSTNGKLFFAKNGTWQASGDPVAGTNAAFTGLTSIYYPEVGHDSYADPSFSINFGQRPVSGGAFDAASGGYFRYTPPSGFKALCTKNLSAAGSVTTSGTFTGNAAADGPYVWLNGTPTAMTIDGNAVTWGTHADKLAGGFKIRTASSPYNDAASNSYTVTTNAGIFKYNNAEKNP